MYDNGGIALHLLFYRMNDPIPLPPPVFFQEARRLPAAHSSTGGLRFRGQGTRTGVRW